MNLKKPQNSSCNLGHLCEAWCPISSCSLSFGEDVWFSEDRILYQVVYIFSPSLFRLVRTSSDEWKSDEMRGDDRATVMTGSLALANCLWWSPSLYCNACTNIHSSSLNTVPFAYSVCVWMQTRTCMFKVPRSACVGISIRPLCVLSSLQVMFRGIPEPLAVCVITAVCLTDEHPNYRPPTQGV